MKKKIEEFYQDINKAIEHSDEELFMNLMEQRKEHIDSIQSEDEKIELLKTYLKMDEKIKEEVVKKQKDIQNILLSQVNKKKAVEKYEQF